MLKRDVGHLANYILRAIPSGSLGQLRERNEVALVLCRHEACGDARNPMPVTAMSIHRSRVQSRLRDCVE